MCAFCGLIANEVTHVNRNCECVIVRACVCMFAGGLAHVGLRLRGENSIGLLMHNS